jgi:hypothetical protein
MHLSSTMLDDGGGHAGCDEGGSDGSGRGVRDSGVCGGPAKRAAAEQAVAKWAAVPVEQAATGMVARGDGGGNGGDGGSGDGHGGGREAHWWQCKWRRRTYGGGGEGHGGDGEGCHPIARWKGRGVSSAKGACIRGVRVRGNGVGSNHSVTPVPPRHSEARPSSHSGEENRASLHEYA